MKNVAKYSKDGVFDDPIVRCDSCSKIVKVETLKKIGMCKCGNRKIRNMATFTSEEKVQMEEWGVDPEFLAQFGPIEVDE